MRIAINATNITVGGGIQVASSFITFCINNKKNFQFLFLISKNVYNNLTEELKKDTRLKVFKYSPARITKRTFIKKQIFYELINFNTDIVLTIFGPSYIKFDYPHLVGFADGWVTHPNKLAMNTLSKLDQLRYKLTSFYKIKHLDKNDFYWVEASVVSKGLIEKVKVKPQNIKVIANTYSQIFTNKRRTTKDKNIMITTVSSPYPHKNLRVIPKLAQIINKKIKDNNVMFNVTLPKNGKEVFIFWKLVDKYNVRNFINNHGVINTSQCVELYNRTDIVFLPTLLESFSASYPEAMFMKKPILTTDLKFAKDICSSAAIYFDPVSVIDASEKLYKLIVNKDLYKKMVERGTKRLDSFPTPEKT